MNAPYYNGEPGARPYDDEREGRRDYELPPLVCRDCGAVIECGGGTTGVASGASCEEDYRWRTATGALFDVRTRRQIEAAMTNGAA